MKKLQVAINGFGRIGRNVVRAFLASDAIHSVDIVAINDVADNETMAHLLQFDTTYGKLHHVVDLVGDELQIQCLDKKISIRLLTNDNPALLPWSKLNIDVVLECSGQFREYHKANWHRQAGAKQVIIGAAPFDMVDASIVMGINHHLLTRQLPIISSVSCTTQALVPLLFVLDRDFGLKSAMMTEIHALTTDQNVLDGAHRDLRRGRAGAFNMIPTTSSSIAAAQKVLPNLKHKINGFSVRVPTITVAAIDVTMVLEQSVSTEDIKSSLYHASCHHLRHIMGYSNKPLVSSDFIQDAHSLVIDDAQIMTIGNQVKVFAWYDNEWGYANRLLDILTYLSKLGKH